MSFLIGADGSPTPPQDILRGIRRVDETLDLHYLRGMETWAIVAPWRQSDPRRQMVRDGLLGDGAAFDIVTCLPPDCPLDQAENYLRRGLMSTKREDIVRMLDRVGSFNEQLLDSLADKATAEVMDDMDSIVSRRVEGKATSFLNDATQKPSAKKKGKRK